MKVTETNPSFMIYIFGIIVFGLFYEFFRRSLEESWWFVGFAVIYLLALRVIGDFFARKWRERRSS